MQIQSPFQVSIDVNKYRSFADYFFASTAEYGTRVAIVDAEGRNFRFVELRGWTEKCVKRLSEIGVSANSCIALVSSINPLAIFVQLAAATLGCRITILNGCLSVDELWYMVDASEANYCIVETQFAQRIDDVRRKALMRGSARIKIIKRLDEVVGDTQLTLTQKRESRTQIPASQSADIANGIASTMSCSAIIMREKLNQTDSADEESNFSHESDKLKGFLILFSSGTTRQPKPVQISHHAVIANIERLRCSVYGPPTTNDKFLLSLCLSTIFGFYSAFYSLINGAELYMLQKHSNKAFLKSLVDHKITYTHVIPFTLQFLANDLSLENVNLKPHLKTIISGGATLDARIARNCRERLGVRDIRQIYGMTELGGPALISHIGNDIIESVGRPLPGIVVKIQKFDSKQLCGPRQTGHLLITGTNIHANIYRNSKATSDLMTSDGYVKTGDAAFFDENGLIYVVDRIKDMIKYRGTLVCPSDIECILRSHPGVWDSAVVGRSDHVSGEMPAAFVVKRQNAQATLSTSEIRQYVSGKIPQFKELRGGVFFLSEIPRSICGKVLRQNLRQHWDRERVGPKTEANESVTPPSRENGNGARKGSKIAEDLAKNRRSSSISATMSSQIRLSNPVLNKFKHKKLNQSTE